jgi:hypothetical protein
MVFDGVFGIVDVVGVGDVDAVEIAVGRIW